MHFGSFLHMQVAQMFINHTHHDVKIQSIANAQWSMMAMSWLLQLAEVDTAQSNPGPYPIPFFFSKSLIWAFDLIWVRTKLLRAQLATLYDNARNKN